MAASGTNPRFLGEFPIALRRDGRESLHRQVEAAVRNGIRDGRLPAGARLPPTRTMAADLGVSRGVVVEAYQQLVAEGYLTGGSGGYTTVAARPRESPTGAPAPVAPVPQPRIDFGYGRADVANFPRVEWLRSIRRVLVETPGDRFLYSAGRGVAELRTALAEYLNRVRGTAADPEDIVLCTGFAQGVALLVGLMSERGARRLAVEDPSADDDARLVARAAGMDVVGIPVGVDGIDVDAL
ncbi:MAG TPA: PLP-dependent aminotransferase family protein, partial [Pseudonocardia sp.]|nr:PLP-dependent aminotransferase family protein [Pseudonocardia sp.]